MPFERRAAHCPSKNVGVWLIGACGSVSSCVVVGAEALRRGLIRATGLVTELPEFSRLDLVGFDQLVFGGSELRPTTPLEAAREYASGEKAFPLSLVDEVRPALEEVAGRIRLGCSLHCGPAVHRLGARPGMEAGRTLRETVETLQAETLDFQRRFDLATVVVVNLASAEPPLRAVPEHDSREGFESLLRDDRRDAVSASLLYAYAALDAKFPYVNFTSSPGSSIGALCQIARENGVPHMGKDGKTGETLLKTVLGPMFLARHLRILSWEGHNLLGNRDGKVLEEPENGKAKIHDKDQALRGLLGDESVHSHVRIDYVPSLGDWKTAWDFIHFEGFFGTRMSLQFIWQGCDSILAAPLVLDLVRFAELAGRRGEAGAMKHLACFFKSPLEVAEQDFFEQTRMLADYAHAAPTEGGQPREAARRPQAPTKIS